MSLGPEAFAEPTRHRTQQRVAGRVAEAVVHGLEVVEVDEHDRDPRPRAAAAQARLVETVHEQRAIRELGEVVAEHALLELACQLPLHRHVAHRDHETGDVLVAEHVHDAHLEVARLTVAVDEHPDELLVRAERQRAAPVELAGDAVRLLRSEGFVEPPPDQRLGLEAEDRTRTRARVRNHARPVDHEDRVVQALHQRAETTQTVAHTRRTRAGCEVPQPQRDEPEHHDRARAGNERGDVAVTRRPRVGERDRRAQRDRGQDAQDAEPVRGVDVDAGFVGRIRWRGAPRSRSATTRTAR